MLGKPNVVPFDNEIWKKIASVSIILFFVFLADAILSSWVPGFVEKTFQSPVVMGLILSFSSVVGLGADLVFPQILKNINFKKLLFLAIVTSMIFSSALFFASYLPFVLIFLFSMASWGIYYEMIGFANHQFVSDAIPMRMHASVWAFTGLFKNLAYFIGPLISGFIVGKSFHLPIYLSLFFSFIAFLILIVSRKRHDRTVTIEIDKISMACECEHWIVLFKKVWPVLIVGLLLGIIDAFFWTTGAVYATVLSENNGWWGSLFLPMYTLPSLFVGLIIVKKGIVSGKKRMALRFFLLSGIFLTMMSAFNSVLWQLLMVFCTGLALAITYPLIDGVYSDIIERMHRQRKHMMGLCSSATSISYIIGPILAGIVTQIFGSINTFVILGVFVIIVAFVIVLATPKKIKLPQEEIKKWKD